MNHLIFQNGASQTLRDELLASEKEAAAILLATAVRTGTGRWRLLVTEILPVPSASYFQRTSASLSLAPEFTAFAMKKARGSGSSMIFVHTHPWGGKVQASSVDRDCERILLPIVFSRVPGVPHARLILGRETHDAALFDGNLEERPVEVTDVGPVLLRFPRWAEDFRSEPTFDRQVRAFGEAGQRRLHAFRVAIVGLGGTGSVVAQQLAHLGVRKLLLIDPDDVEETNLNRVVGATRSDIGRSKVEVARRMLAQINPAVEVEVLKDTVLKAGVARKILDTDVFFCCTDSHGSRAILNQIAYQYLLPGFDLGVVIQSSDASALHIVGRVQMLAPGLACLVCAEVLDPEQVRRDLMTEEQRRADPYIVGTPQAQPAVISINSAVASLAVTMYLAAAAGIPVKTRHQIARFETGTIRPVMNEPVHQCIVCSVTGALARGDKWPIPGRP